MTDDWYVPGVLVSHGARVIRLRPPEHWVRLIIELARVPPSMNTNVGRGHWSAFHREKKSWQEEIEQYLLVNRVMLDIRPGSYERALAGAYLRFDRRKKQRDPSNFATVVNKALGDALVTMGSIPDDDAAHYVFGGVEFEEEIGAPRTRIVLYLQPKEEACH